MHKLIEEHSHAAGLAIKEEGSDNDVFRRLGQDERFPLSESELNKYLEDPHRFTGRAEQQTEEFLDEIVKPVLEERIGLIGESDVSINV
jgi:adenylosuccinate lyase